jgi:enamine deaminase RidA (YjgF/YER057c/UK114 family)
MKKEYKVVVPGKPDRFEEEVESCLQQLSGARAGLKLFKLVVFLDSESETDFFPRREFVRSQIVEFFNDKIPAFSILSQKPEPPFQIVIESGYVESGEGDVDYKETGGHFYTVIQNEYEKELWSCGNGNCPTTGSVKGDAERAFKEVLEVLEQEGMTYDNVVRQWNYIGEILKVDRQNGCDIQNYQLFNEVRNQYFKEFRTKKEYPAATGIGKSHRGVSIDFCAINENRHVKAYSVDNEKQITPYAYAQSVLVGESSDGTKVKQAPQFERAKLVVTPLANTLFLSGTASIIGEETIGVGNLEKQTKITAQHLNTLQGYQNLSNYCQSFGFTRGEYVCLRVYVKNASDMRNAKMLCASYFGESVPMAFVLADVCRDNLLIEIEGEVRL